MDIFISYTWKDLEIVSAIESGLKAAGFTVWRDESELRAGQALGVQVEHALEEAKCVLACISPAAIRSGWVRAEMRRARGKLLPAVIQPFEKSVDLDADLGNVLYRDLTPWVDGESNAPWEKLVDDCYAMLGQRGAGPSAAPPTPRKPQATVSIHNTGTVGTLVGHVQGNIRIGKGGDDE